MTEQAPHQDSAGISTSEALFSTFHCLCCDTVPYIFKGFLIHFLPDFMHDLLHPLARKLALALQGNSMRKKTALLAAGMTIIGLLAAFPTYASPPDWAPAHGHRAKQERQYEYVYYPAQQIYYAPSNGMWFWLNGGNWQVGVNLPPSYQGYRRTEGLPVVLTSSRPYVQHVYVEEHYGRPWREKHRHKAHKNRSHDKHHHGHKDD